MDAKQATSELKEVQGLVMDIQQQLYGMGRMLILASASNHGQLNETHLLGIGSCIEDVAKKLFDGEGCGVSDRLKDVEKFFKETEVN